MSDELETRSALLSERDDLTRRIDAMTAELAAVADAAAGSNIDDEHDPEGATVAFEREQLAAARTRAQQKLTDLDAAIERLGAGDYGRSTECGGPIGAERLAALPATRTCVRCSAARASRAHR
ncbi:MAG: TraR/DksA family transcriptional regulator [Jatrophihabitans sp.]|uniref:TraR/DksA family transcriptional regulator n=1 Tax=Jatrophihabitans sp. TaxID=1932789 RepID=UPI003F818A59